MVVPHEYVKDGEIVLNVSPLATNRLSIGNEFLEFQARFGGVPREVRVPVEAIRAIYARETGQGMAFETGAGQLPGTDDATVKPVEPGALGAAAPPLPDAAPSPAAGPLLRVLQPPESREPPPDPPPASGGPGERPRLTRVK